MREQQILHKIKKGDQQTLNNFIQDLYPYVYSFTYRKMQGDDSAKDITQEVFVRFIRQLPCIMRRARRCIIYTGLPVTCVMTITEKCSVICTRILTGRKT